MPSAPELGVPVLLEQEQFNGHHTDADQRGAGDNAGTDRLLILHEHLVHQLVGFWPELTDHPDREDADGNEDKE